MVPTFSPSVLFLKLKYPQALSWPGTEGFPSSTKACPIYLRNVSGTFPLLCIPILLLLLDFDYLGPNHFKFPCLLSLPTPKTELRMLLSWQNKQNIPPLLCHRPAVNPLCNWNTVQTTFPIGNQLTFPTFGPLNTCVPVILSCTNCHSLNIPWLFNAPVCFGHSVPLSWISRYPLLYLLNCSQAFKTRLPSPLMKFFQIFPVRSGRSNNSLSQHSVLLLQHSLSWSVCYSWPLSSCLPTVRACKAGGVSDSTSSPMAIGHTRFKINNHSLVVYKLCLL